MQLSKTVPARRKTITFRWLRKDWIEMSKRYRKIRSGSRNKMDSCYWCGHKFEDGEMFALASLEELNANKTFCHACVDLIVDEEANQAPSEPTKGREE